MPRVGEERDSRESARESRNGEVDGALSETNGWGTRYMVSYSCVYVSFGLLGWVSFLPFSLASTIHVLTCIVLMFFYLAGTKHVSLWILNDNVTCTLY